jgi:hypothetical protein
MWTDKDEKDFQRLAKKRRQYKTESGYDFKFMSDLAHGEEGERLIKDALLKAEVKRDNGAYRTGNVYVEHESWGKESGITTTESDYIIFLLSEGYDDEVFVGVKTSRLRKILEKITWITRGGDSKSSKGKLVKLSKLLKSEV